MDILEQSRDVLDLYKNKLPDTITRIRKQQ